MRRKLCLVATIPFPLNVFMRHHLVTLRKEYDVTLVADGEASDVSSLLGDSVSFTPVQIERKISPLRDTRALVALWRLFRREKFDAVHSIMPKAGLLSMVAARFAGVPLRFHTFTGQVWVTRSGPMRALLKFLDRILVANSSVVLADSFSQRDFLIEEGIVSRNAIRVLADGSVCGVDLSRFAYDCDARRRVRERHGIPAGDIVFVYLGRLNRDKGISDLLAGFAIVAERAGNAHLLVAGADEAGFDAEIARLASRFPGRVHRFGFTEQPEEFLSSADVYCQPSYREGFSNVIIEAGAAGVPSIASDIYGITDAVDAGATGVLHQPGSIEQLSDAMELLLNDADLRRRMGDAARLRAQEKFSARRLTAALLAFYDEQFLSVSSERRRAPELA